MVRVWVRCRLCSRVKLLLVLGLGLGLSVRVNVSVRSAFSVLCE